MDAFTVRDLRERTGGLTEYRRRKAVGHYQA